MRAMEATPAASLDTCTRELQVAPYNSVTDIKGKGVLERE